MSRYVLTAFTARLHVLTSLKLSMHKFERHWHGTQKLAVPQAVFSIQVAMHNAGNPCKYYKSYTGDLAVFFQLEA